MTEQIETNEPEVFTIPSVNMERLIKEVNKLNRRAEKLGFPKMNINVLGKREVIHPKYINRNDLKEEQKPRITVSDITLEGDAPKIEGYEFVGTLDHYSIPGSVIVRAVPGQSVPEEFHNIPPICNHCGKKRHRTETFVLHEELTNKHIAVGRQCVRDFIGYNVAALARYLTRWNALFSSFGDFEDERWYGGRIQLQFSKEDVLAATFGTIRVKGWKPKSACNFEEGDVPTSAHVAEIFDPPMFVGRHAAEARRRYEEFCADVRTSRDADLVKAEQAIEWLDNQNDSNEYMHNLKVIRDADSVPLNMFGFWCSLAAAYERAMDRLEIKKAEKKKQLNEWVGDIKQRRDFEVSVISIKVVDGYYGPVRIHRMLDKDGRTLVWFANTQTDMEKGGSYKIKGTIKKHEKYEEWCQTILSRVALIEEL